MNESIDPQYEAEFANYSNYGDHLNNQRCNCGYEQLLTELSHIREVEIPHMESEYQSALYYIKHLLIAFHDGSYPVAELLEEASNLVQERYTEPTREVTDSDELPF